MDVITIILGILQLILTGVVIFMYMKYKKDEERRLQENEIKDGDRIQLYTQYSPPDSPPKNYTIGYKDGSLKLLDPALDAEYTYFQINFPGSLNNKSTVTFKHVKSGKYLTVNCDNPPRVYLNDSKEECNDKKSTCSTFTISLNETAKADDLITSSSVIRIYVNSLYTSCKATSSQGYLVVADNKTNSIVLQDADCLQKVQSDQTDKCKDNKSLIWLLQKVKETPSPSPSPTPTSS